MTISPGSRLGPYEVLSPLGAGGMGEVWKARDTRLERTVAIKVLPQHLSSSPEIRQRFEREAKTISQLSHPHICALYDVGSHEGSEYLVMEYLEGETLADRVAKGPLPLDQTLKYGVEIADALDKAHRQEIVHRDLKPGNVMLTKSGVKLLDFGLAKAMTSGRPLDAAGRGQTAAEHDPMARNSLTALPTVAGGQNLTQEGTILGTFQYMAPEQLEGKEADIRSDIFAFGAVLYEMATARKAFAGNSQASLITAIMSSEPTPISSVQPMTPPVLDRVVKKCLAKDPEDRWQNASDLASELKWVAEGSQAGLSAPVLGRRRNRERLAWTAGALLAAALATLAVSDLRRARPERRVTRFSVAPPPGESLSGTLALSPDGRWLAFTTGVSNASLWLHSFESDTSKPLPGTRNARYPFWSPDGKSVAFFADGKLKKMDASGSPPQIVCDAGDTRGGSWSSDGQILFSPSFTSGLYSVPAGGGTPVPLTTLDTTRQENSHRWPLRLPDGRRYLFVVMSGRSESRGIFLGVLGSATKKRLLPDMSSVAYAPEGYLVFRRQTALMAQRFDPGSEKLIGEPFTVADTVRGDSSITALVAFSVSAEGTLAYRSGAAEPTRFVWLDRNGKELSAVPESDNVAEPALSPDQRRVVWHRADQSGTEDLWLLDLARGTSSRFTFDPSDDVTPVWSPDGSRIVFSSSRKGNPDLYEKAASGATEEKLLLQTALSKYPDDCSRDGKYILYEENDPKTLTDLWVLPLFGDRKPVPYLKTPFNEAHAQFSPDGKWIAYVSDEAGRPEIYVQSFPASGGKWQVSAGGGDQPAWRRDGRELSYVSWDRKMMSVSVNVGATFEAGVPQVLFAAPIPSLGVSGDRTHYAVTADGQRFLLRKVLEEKVPSPVTVVLNWASEGKK